MSVGLTTRIIIHHLTFKDIIARFFFFFFQRSRRFSVALRWNRIYRFRHLRQHHVNRSWPFLFFFLSSSIENDSLLFYLIFFFDFADRYRKSRYERLEICTIKKNFNGRILTTSTRAKSSRRIKTNYRKNEKDFGNERLKDRHEDTGEFGGGRWGTNASRKTRQGVDRRRN